MSDSLFILKAFPIDAGKGGPESTRLKHILAHLRNSFHKPWVGRSKFTLWNSSKKLENKWPHENCVCIFYNTMNDIIIHISNII